MNQLINDGGVCRTAPATPGLLNIHDTICRRAAARPSLLKMEILSLQIWVLAKVLMTSVA